MNSYGLHLLIERKSKLEQQAELVDLAIKYPPAGCSNVLIWRDVQTGLLKNLHEAIADLAEDIRLETEQGELAIY